MMTKMLPTVCKTYIAKTQFLFHCNIKIKIPESFGEVLLDECFAILKMIDLNYNSYQVGSYFHQINQQAGNWVEVDNACISMIQQLQKVSECTDGAYDISCMPLLQLWGFYREENFRVPTDSEIRESLSKIDYRKIEIKGNKVRIAANQELITGSFLKSFAVDQLIDFLKNKGVTDAIINAGGSTIFGLNDETHETWKINLPIQNTENSANQITISNQCFSLSARVHNRIRIQGKEYGHIFNSKTGYPTETSQVGVWCEHAFLADVLSTAIFSLDKTEVSNVIQRLKSVFEFEYFRIEKN